MTTDRDLINEAREHLAALQRGALVGCDCAGCTMGRETSPRWVTANLGDILDRFVMALDDIRSLAEALRQRNALMRFSARKLGMVGDPTPARVATRIGMVMDAVRSALVATPSGVTWPELEALRTLLGGQRGV